MCKKMFYGEKNVSVDRVILTILIGDQWRIQDLTLGVGAWTLSTGWVGEYKIIERVEG